MSRDPNSPHDPPAQPEHARLLASLHTPHRETVLSLPAWLAFVVREMRAGTWALPACEAMLVVKDQDAAEAGGPDIITILYWGRDTGLTSEGTLAGIAELNRKQ